MSTTRTTTTHAAATTATTPTATTSTSTTLTATTSTADRLAALSVRLREYEADRIALLRIRSSGLDDGAHAERAARLALVGARITGVWRLIATHAVGDLTVPDVYRHAAVIAECDARDTARFWRDIARDWRARAEHRPTSDAAGALSNWAELGVAT